jgi:tetratricopeptide (TPR) repeat protein
MVTSQANPAIRQAIAQTIALAGQCLRVGNLAGAEQALAQVPPGDHPGLLHIAGVLRMHQQRHAEAAGLFARARAADPKAAILAFSHATALQWLEQPLEAVAAFREAIRLKPDYREAHYELGRALQQLGRLDEAEAASRQWIAAMPGDAQAKLALGSLLLTAGRARDAEAPLRQGLGETRDPAIKAVLHGQLGFALRRQRKDADALDEYDKALALNPGLSDLALHRAESLQNLQRHDEALDVLRAALAREPHNPELHHRTNDLLYRLGREDYLASYDRAPRTAALLLSKAFFLSHEKRGEEALETYRQAEALEPGNMLAATGAANALTMLGRHGEAVNEFERLIARHGENADLYGCAAEAALLGGEPARAAAFCERALARSPHDQSALAILGTAWRALDDARDENLNRYDTLVQSFELEAPAGFSRMEDFNAELNAWLDRMHPQTREHLNQSLRGGTQTPDQLFGAGHGLVERLKARIDETVARYIAALGDDARHPFLSRRTRDIRYAGSWSSRLRDCGFHVNHIHPQGWISSCYYVAVPEVVTDQAQRQGWIKFGEPSFDIALKNPIRRAIQPVPGRLVLFPSYMWHGTVPFHDRQPRTTIAFDIAPNG